MISVPVDLETIAISERAAQNVEGGNLWIFSNEIVGKISNFDKGAWCRFESKGRFVGLGYINPHSLIAGRIISQDETDTIEKALSNGLVQAFRRRKDLDMTDSGRLVYSEADFLPGLVLDYFSGVLVLQSNTAGIDSVLPYLEEEIPSAFKKVFGADPLAFVVKADSGIRKLEGVENFSKVVFGKKEFLEGASFSLDKIRYAIDFMEGQKTGFFLDQRDNRRFFSHLIHQMKSPLVLDLFCYSGGWGLAGLKSGAERVTFVDESSNALALVEKGLALNGFQSNSAHLVRSDVFDFLEREKSSYDIVVADPPAFVKSKKTLPQAKRAYEKLFRLAWLRLKEGGILFASSCSYHLAEAEFMEILQSVVAKEKVRGHLIYRGGQAADHPILLSMPETKYLKCAAIQKIDNQSRSQN